MMPMSWRSMFWLVARLPVAFATPPADWTRLVTIGILAPILISASSLWEVWMWGAERMLVFPRLAEARIRPEMKLPLIAPVTASTVRVSTAAPPMKLAAAWSARRPTMLPTVSPTVSPTMGSPVSGSVSGGPPSGGIRRARATGSVTDPTT